MRGFVKGFLLAAALALAAPGAGAQALVARLAGSFGAVLPDGGVLQGYFHCTTLPTCTGTYYVGIRSAGCSNLVSRQGEVRIAGLELGEPSRIAAALTLANVSYQDLANTDGTCAPAPGTDRDMLFALAGLWNGSTGIVTLRSVDPFGRTVVLNGSFTADLPGGNGVFPMDVSGQIDLQRANITANLRPRPADIGQRASLFVFARAPANRVKGAILAKTGEPIQWARGTAKDEPVQCVLAQLTATGELQGVSVPQLQAFLTGVLTSSGQSATILDNVPPAGLAGATFYLGYGATPGTMVVSGTNRSVVTVPSTVTCQPQPPEDGWWWNPLEPGRGYSLEARGANLFFASYLYDATGHATWLAATGPTSLDGSAFTGELLAFSGGQTLTGAYKAPFASPTPGPITLTFNDATHGTLVWPGGSMAIERFNIVADGLNAAEVPSQPETGWWWNPAEGGRGFFLEWQGASAFVAGYMYEATGAPVWYASFMATPDIRSLAGTWQQFGGGQPLVGAYKPATVANANVGPLAIAFTSATAGTLTLPDGRRIAITRFRF